jgi:rubrerythrin
MLDKQNMDEDEEKPLCPKCGTILEEIDGEQVCPKCDLEIDYFGEGGEKEGNIK